MNYCEKCMRPIAHGAVCDRCGKQPPAPAHHLKPGTVLQQKYIIGRAIGQGGFGITYIGRDLVLDTMVAIKEYYPGGEVSRDHTVSGLVVRSNIEQEAYEKALERFLMEARILAKFSNEPGVVGVRDFFRENDTAYIVMEYLDGITMKEYLRIKGPIRADVLIKLMEPVLQVLHKIHQRGLIHRDISPDNLMLMQDGRLKLLDFGAARAFTDEKSLSIVLKQGYAPVEQYWNGDQQGAWTDVYAVCATIYKCMTGVTPVAAVKRAVEDELKKPSELGISIVPGQEQALMKGLAVAAADRYASMEELICGFHAAAPAAQPVVPIAVPDREVGSSYAGKAAAAAERKQEKRNNLPLILTLIAVVAAVLGLIIWLAGVGKEEPAEEKPQTQQSEQNEEEKEPAEPVIVAVRNVTLTEGIDRLELQFETDDAPEYWVVSCKTEGEEAKEQQFTGNSVHIEDLKPDTRYEVQLMASEDAELEEPVILIGRTLPGVSIAEMQAEISGEAAEITWEFEGEAPDEWQITVVGDKGYDEELTAKENKVTLEDLVFEENYIVTIQCENMPEPFEGEFTADVVYVEEIKAEVEDGAVTVTWKSSAEDHIWYVVCTPDDEPDRAWTQQTEEQTIRLTELQPGKTYTIELQTKEGEKIAGESAVTVEIPKAKGFSDYGFAGARGEFYLRPDGRNWSTEDLEDSRTDFTSDEQIVFACSPEEEPESSRDKVKITIMVKDDAGNTVDFQSLEEHWNDLWEDGGFAVELGKTPSEEGTYTVELYFNGEKADLSRNSFTIE